VFHVKHTGAIAGRHARPPPRSSARCGTTEAGIGDPAKMIDEFLMPLQETVQGITAQNEQAATAGGSDVGTPRLAHQEHHVAENVSGPEPHRSSLEIDLYRT
jgi:hypothetical protein